LELQRSLSPPLRSRRSSQPQIVAQQTLTNRSESPFSEIDFRLGDHQHLKGYFLDNSRDRLLR
jgi:hypothetical protein